MRRLKFSVVCLLGIAITVLPDRLSAQQGPTTKKQLQFSAIAAKDDEPIFHLLPSEEEQEPGNAIPVLLRMVYEQRPFMEKFDPKLHEYAEMELNNPKLHELGFGSFARQIIRAGSMSYADWEYPLQSADEPDSILLPDMQSQRHYTGRGMTAWIKQRISKGELDNALKGIKAQLGCGRHCAATPVAVCHLVGLAIANRAFDNLELAIQFDDCPNMYWSLATLSPTLHDLGPMVRWELWASLARANEHLPATGDDEWKEIARKFVERYAAASNERYTKKEGTIWAKKLEALATKELSKSFDFSEAEIANMTTEERIMRWIYLRYYRLRTQIEPMTYQNPRQFVATMNKIEAEDRSLLAATGAKSSPFPVNLPLAILTCRSFDRRVKFLQTIEAIRDHTSSHGGDLPNSLKELRLPAPNDPFTEKPFVYTLKDGKARIRQGDIEGYTNREGYKPTTYDYELSVRK